MSARDELLGHRSTLNRVKTEVSIVEEVLAGEFAELEGKFFDRQPVHRVPPGELVFDWKRGTWSLVVSNTRSYVGEDNVERRQFSLISMPSGTFYLEVFVGLLDVLILAPARDDERMIRT